jgi:hypothetical protein
MKAICLYNPELESPYRGVLFLEGEQTPEEAIEEYVSKRFEDEPEDAEWFKDGLKYFYVHPVAARRISKTPEPDYASDSIQYVMSHYKVNLLAMWEVRTNFSMTQAEMEAMEEAICIGATQFPFRQEVTTNSESRDV